MTLYRFCDVIRLSKHIYSYRIVVIFYIVKSLFLITLLPLVLYSQDPCIITIFYALLSTLLVTVLQSDSIVITDCVLGNKKA